MTHHRIGLILYSGFLTAVSAAIVKAQDCFPNEPGLPIVQGTEFDDTLVGSPVADRICGYGGNDNISGLEGDDFISGGDGSDTINGNQGDDFIHANAGNDLSVRGGQGNDTIRGGQGDDIVHGDLGNDWMFGDKGTNTVYGGDGNDWFVFGFDHGPSTLIDTSGSDSAWIAGLQAVGWADPRSITYLPNVPGHTDLRLMSGGTIFTIPGFYASSTISTFYFGNNGVAVEGPTTPPGSAPYGHHDVSGAIQGWAYDPNSPKTPIQVHVYLDGVLIAAPIANLPRQDVLDAGETARAEVGFSADFPVDVASGYHTVEVFAIDAQTGTGTLLAGSSQWVLTGDSQDNVLQGTPGVDIIVGLSGNDVIFAAEGGDSVHGRSGSDELHGEDGDDFLNGNEDADFLNGNKGDDTVRGGMGDDTVRGGKDDDEVHGDNGSDDLWGDRGQDVIWGGSGADVFHYRLGDGDDVIEDIESVDSIVFHQIRQERVTFIPLFNGDLRIEISANLSSGSILLRNGDGVPFGVQYEFKPNFIVVFADDLGYGHPGSLGQTQIATPNLDQMAAEGLLFREFYSGAPHCPPARSALLEGKHVGHTYIRSGGHFINTLDLLPQRMRDGGYITGMFGKWGMGEHSEGLISAGDPAEFSFDRFLGYMTHRDAHVYYLDSPATCDLGTVQTPFYCPKDVHQSLFETRGGQTKERVISPTEYTHDVFFQETLSFVDEFQGAPFFLYLPFTIPHAELVVPDDSLDQYLDGAGQSVFPEIPYSPNCQFCGLICEPTPQGACPGYRRANDKPRATFAGMVSRLDRDMGTLLATLESLGLDDTTMVFFTSDNGPHDAGGIQSPAFFDGTAGLSGMKWSLLEGGIRVPMIAWGPGWIQTPGEVTDPFAAWDIYPTIADLAELPVPNDLDGISMAPTLVGQPQPQHEFLYWETFNPRADYVQAVRIGDWKALRPVDGFEVELYDLSADPAELSDLSRLPENEAIVAQAKKIMNTARVPPVLDPEMHVTPYCQCDLGYRGPGVVSLNVCGDDLTEPQSVATLSLIDAPPNSPLLFAVGLNSNPTPFAGGDLVPVPWLALLGGVNADAQGVLETQIFGGAQSPIDLFMQAISLGTGSFELSNAVQIEIGI